MTEDLYTTKRSLELEWQQEHLKEGKYNINMSYIDKKIQVIIKEIIDEEFKAATRLKPKYTIPSPKFR